ncbi:hypothetical protein F2Q68_00029817 [Brassica cretica]|uniref:Uncharacterized protein n=1 Tax=Brassica cretica TaxID=69181 RepID=A0A8S9GEJ6_BRACR|nr:hypothetical protein F2Q68_00029817 [Brassica cretica]
MKSVLFQSKEHEGDAEEVLDFGSAHTFFDKLTQRASNCIASPTSSDVTTATTLAPAVSPASLVYSDKASVKSMEMFTRDTFAAKVVEHENVYVGSQLRFVSSPPQSYDDTKSQREKQSQQAVATTICPHASKDGSQLRACQKQYKPALSHVIMPDEHTSQQLARHILSQHETSGRQ